MNHSWPNLQLPTLQKHTPRRWSAPRLVTVTTSNPRNIFISSIVAGPAPQTRAITSTSFLLFLISRSSSLPRSFDMSGSLSTRLKFFVRHKTLLSFFMKYYLLMPARRLTLVFRKWSPLSPRFVEHLVRLKKLEFLYFKPATPFGFSGLGRRASVKKKIYKKFFLK